MNERETMTTTQMTMAEWLVHRAQEYKTKADMKVILTTQLDLVSQEAKTPANRDNPVSAKLVAQIERALQLLDQAKGVPEFVRLAKADPLVASAL